MGFFFELPVSKVAQSVQPSLARHIFNLAKEYEDVIDFTLGDPDIQPHQSIKEAACAAIQQGKTRYSQNAGLLQLRQAISNYYNRTELLKFNPTDEVIVTVGAMEGLYLALLTLLNPGDEVIIPAPYYVNYVQMVNLCHAVPVVVDNPVCTNLSFRLEDVEAAITTRTRAIIINTPSNPSGRLIPRDKIIGLANLAKKYNLVVISDEVYKRLIYDNKEFSSIIHIKEMRERTILVNSLSKEFCMTGYRIGYVLAPAPFIEEMTKLQENICACASLPSQYAAIEALSGKKDFSTEMVNIFATRRNLLVEGIQQIPLLSCTPPEATFYLMVDISATGMKSEEFAIALLKAVQVACVPGITYGKSCDNYIRIAFTLNEEKIREGIRRIQSFIQTLKQ